MARRPPRRRTETPLPRQGTPYRQTALPPFRPCHPLHPHLDQPQIGQNWQPDAEVGDPPQSGHGSVTLLAVGWRVQGIVNQLVRLSALGRELGLVVGSPIYPNIHRNSSVAREPWVEKESPSRVAGDRRGTIFIAPPPFESQGSTCHAFPSAGRRVLRPVRPGREAMS